jgi:hypothetical protein
MDVPSDFFEPVAILSGERAGVGPAFTTISGAI